MSELKGCPSCGDPLEIYKSASGWFWMCISCGLTAPSKKTKQEAIDHANARPGEEQAGREGMEAALDCIGPRCIVSIPYKKPELREAYTLGYKNGFDDCELSIRKLIEGE